MGSLNINGTIRDFFVSPKFYIGVDLEHGPGVDLVAEAQKVNLPDNLFDVAVSSECFEHNPYWLETFLNMYRLAREFVVFTCASEGRPEHGTTRSSVSDSPFTATKWDYYRNLSALDFESKLNLSSMFSQHQFICNSNSHDLYFWGIKASSSFLS